MIADMKFEHGVQLMCIDLELGRDHRRHTPGPVDPGIALVAGEPEHLRHGFRPDRQRALHALEPDLAAPEPRRPSLAVRACMTVIAPGAIGSPCLRRVSRAAPAAASGTGFVDPDADRVGSPPRAGRCCAGSVLPAQAALTSRGSQAPSGSRLIRPAFSARRAAVSLPAELGRAPDYWSRASIQRPRSQALGRLIPIDFFA